MILTRLLLDYNVYILATYGDKLSYDDYFNLIRIRFFEEANHNFLIEFYADIDKHHKEFYIHHSAIYDHHILKDPKITLPSLVSFFDSMNLVEGMDYIIVDSNGAITNGPFDNVVYLTKESKISDFILVSDWRVFNERRIRSIIEKHKDFKIKKFFRLSTHILLTPRGFLRLTSKTDSNERTNLIDYYINYRFTTYGYIQYIKLVNNAKENRLSFGSFKRDGKYNDTKPIGNIRAPDEDGSPIT